MARRSPREEDREVIRYAGGLGHRYCVVASSEEGKRHVKIETDSLLSAADLAGYNDPETYERVGMPARWAKVKK